MPSPAHTTVAVGVAVAGHPRTDPCLRRYGSVPSVEGAGRIEKNGFSGGNCALFEFFGAHELISFHGDRDLKRRIARGPLTSQYFPQTTDPNRWIATGKSDQVFDPTAHVDGRSRQETYAAGTDIASLFDAVYPDCPQLQYMQGKLKLVPLSTTLIQVFNVMPPTYESNCTSTLFSFFYNKKPVSVTSVYARLIVMYAQLDGCSPAVRHYPNQPLIVFGMLLVHAKKVHRLSSIGL